MPTVEEKNEAAHKNPPGIAIKWGLKLLALLLIILPLLIFTARFMFLQQTELKDDDEQGEVKTETQALFELLMAQPDFMQSTEDGLLLLPAKDALLIRKVRGEFLDKTAETLMDRLYNSIAGKAVRRQIELWNHTRRFAAVRDDYQANDKTSLHWKARNAWGSSLAVNAWVSLNYGYVNGGLLRSGFHGWVSASSYDDLLFYADVHLLKPKKITLQVVGQPDIRGLPGRKRLLACYPLSDDAKIRGKTASCNAVSANGKKDADAFEIQIHLPAGRHRLRLPIKTVSNPENKINGLPIQRFVEINQQQRFVWNSVREWHYNPVQSFKPSFDFTLSTQDGEALTRTARALPTDFTRDNGLLTLVGYDKSDRFSLAGLLSRSGLPSDNTEVRLTLESQIQRLAQQHLELELQQVDKKNRYTKYRRASVLFMNPQTGAILAAANAPNPPDGIHYWDRASFSRLYPNSDPFVVNAWQGLDNHNSPGSTFKTVTSLAALRAMEAGRKDLQKMVTGLGSGAFQRLTGLSFGSYSYFPGGNSTTIKNSSNYVIGKATRRPLRARDCLAKDEKIPHSTNLGLRESVRDSINTWFARLGVLMDRRNLDDAAHKTELMKMARLLNFESIEQLADQGLPLERVRGNLAGARGDVLNGQTGRLSLAEPALGKPLQRLAQNSFGQGVAATPMQMARVAASISTGFIPKPYLISVWDGKTLPIPARRALNIENIDYLKQGMKAVPEVGTARRAFAKAYSKGRCRVYGKTGTAQISNRKGSRFPFNTAWFVGWREDKDGKADLSFACFVTHTYIRRRRNGGNVCGPIIARVLHDLDALKLKQLLEEEQAAEKKVKDQTKNQDNNEKQGEAQKKEAPTKTSKQTEKASAEGSL